MTFASGARWKWLQDILAAAGGVVNREVYKVDISGGVQPMQFARYGVGEKYGEHVDVYPGRTDSLGRRSLSCSVVLRPAEHGGALHFPRTVGAVPHQAAGDAVFFRADERHAVRPVEAGTRDALVLGFCGREPPSAAPS